jgi:hypothetical protein
MFSAAEKISVRLHAGYPDFGNQYQLESVFFGEGYELLEKNRRLEFALDNLSAEAESFVKSTLLPDLNTLRDDVFNTRENADTAQAAVWTRNANEYSERKRIYHDRRVELCQFLNIPVGPNLNSCAPRRVRS